MVFLSMKREREKKREKETTKKDENQRERDLLPCRFGRSEIICGTRWAAAADLIDCAPNDRKITWKNPSTTNCLLVYSCLSQSPLLPFILFSYGRITFFTFIWPKVRIHYIVWLWREKEGDIPIPRHYIQERERESREPPGGESVCVFFFFYDYIFERCLRVLETHMLAMAPPKN